MPLSDKPQDVSICCSFGLSNVALQRRRIDHIKSRSEKWNVLHLPRHLVLPKPTRDIEQPQLFAYGKRNEKVYTVIPQPPRKGKTRHPAKFRQELVPSWWITSYPDSHQSDKEKWTSQTSPCCSIHIYFRSGSQSKVKYHYMP
jgi:hypothetical protein